MNKSTKHHFSQFETSFDVESYTRMNYAGDEIIGKVFWICNGRIGSNGCFRVSGECEVNNDGEFVGLSLKIQPDGYWSDMINVTIRKGWRHRDQHHYEVTQASGGRFSHDGMREDGTVGVPDDLDAAANMAAAMAWAVKFARSVRAKEATAAKAKGE